jgi:hypothetical protein
MNTSNLIQAKFQAWAKRNCLPVQGDRGDQGKKNYTMTVEENLFGSGLADEVRKAFIAGAGRELTGEICSLQAMHSSAAMTVNVFQYWLINQDLGQLAKLLSIPSPNIERLSFEKQLPVCADPKSHGFGKSPHLDVCFEYKRGARVGVECKLHEPFGGKDDDLLSNAYLKLSDPWNDIPSWKELARKLTKTNLDFKRLGPSQLVKHVLGLKFGRRARDVRLVYFYFDGPGRENSEHLDEIGRFSELVAGDPIKFQPISIQEFIAKAFRALGESHADYVQYLSDRYL